MKHAIKLLIKIYFSILANGFTILLNRREAVKKLVLKIVKNKKKQRCINSLIQKNYDKDISTWTHDYCLLYLKTYGAV